MTASRFRDHELIDDPDYYRALNEISAVASAGAPARWLAALGPGHPSVTDRQWAWDHVVDRVSLRLGPIAGVYERGLLTELSLALDRWYTAAPTALADEPALAPAVVAAPAAARTATPLAKSLGMPAEHITDPAALAPALRRAFSTPGPKLLDVVVDGKV